MSSKFGDKLAQWRENAGLTQDGLGRRIGRSGPWVTQTEKGPEARGRGLPPPTKETCGRLDEALGLPAGTVWSEAAPERMRLYDADLLDWHRSEVQAAGAAAAEAQRGADALVRRLTGLNVLPSSSLNLLDRVEALEITHGVDVLGAVSALLTTGDPEALVEALTAFKAISAPKGRERAVKAFRETCVAIAEARGDSIPPLRPAPRDPAGGVPSTGEPFTPGEG